jgi:Cu-processing system permease protein
VPLSAVFLIGFGAPFLMHTADGAPAATLGVIAACGVLLTFSFTAIAAWLVARIDDRVRGIGAAIGLWLGLTVVYDGLVMMGLAMLEDFPLEPPALAAMVVNPIDLARVLILLRLDVSALMGYTGAVFERFFGSTSGAVVAALALVTWTGVPLLLGARRFQRKDF